MATSELNQFLENVDEKVLECTICFKRLQNPKSLNCLHSFCLSCLEDWVKEKGRLTCPTCSKSYRLPEGGLQKLPPNTFINNLLETIEQFSGKDQIKCACKKREAAIYYCQDCRQYLCSTGSEYHHEFRLFANHKLHSVEDLRSMSTIQKASLHPPQCLLHSKPLEFYCVNCTTPVCVNCTIMNHKEWEGKHKPICISEAFQTFKETSATLEKAVSDCKNKLQDGLKAVTQIATKLGQSKATTLRNIDNHVQLMIKKIKENGDKIKNEVETIYKKKKKVNDVQMDELKTTISDINTKLSFLNQLLQSDEATAMQSGERLITALKERINELPKTKPDDNGQIKFVINENLFDSLQQCDIGYVSQGAADHLTLKGVEYALQGQTIVVKIIKADECKIHANQLKATWTQPTGETSIIQVQEDDNGDYFVTGKCTSTGICKLDVSASSEPIKQSPVIVKVEKEGLVNTIKIINNVNVYDVVKCEDGCLLVSCLTNVIFKYKQSGEYIGKVMLPQGVQVFKMFKMKSGNIAFSDLGNNNTIKVCNMNGQVIKSIGQGVLSSPYGIHVHEASNVVYAGDFNSDYVYMFDFDNDNVNKQIGSKNKHSQISGVCDVTLTNQGHCLILYSQNQGLQLFNNEGQFLKVLVESGVEDGKVMYPHGVVVDEDDNIIISSHHKLQLFSSDGSFMKRIDKPEDKIKSPRGLSVISHHPRRLAVANYGDKTVKIFNY
ncbi:tripartite motif-containing protein 2-like isoform X2 [Anneissia japonica]|uniref:tripartite motif-containing protein 2-like isoform X1 n=1 Tax=Anneissia japonica TaxID=1529436 RepID=UPI0014255DFA|nr:tripartite motif-containing protein 2-like isoform X1 [Anneissia japonica]XP_033109389.1 tripartite motif-containing protein 2-like isoform X2 [Anneissia japonica]